MDESLEMDTRTERQDSILVVLGEQVRMVYRRAKATFPLLNSPANAGSSPHRRVQRSRKFPTPCGTETGVASPSRKFLLLNGP